MSTFQIGQDLLNFDFDYSLLQGPLENRSTDALMSKLCYTKSDEIHTSIEDLEKLFYSIVNNGAKSKETLHNVLERMHSSALEHSETSYKVAKLLGKVIDWQSDGVSMHDELFSILQKDFQKRDYYEYEDPIRYFNSIIFLSEVVDAVKVDDFTKKILLQNLLVHLIELIRYLESDALHIFLKVLIVNREILYATALEDITKLYASLRLKFLDSNVKLAPRTIQMLSLAIDLTGSNFTWPVSHTRDVYVKQLGHRYTTLENRAIIKSKMMIPLEKKYEEKQLAFDASANQENSDQLNDVSPNLIEEKNSTGEVLLTPFRTKSIEDLFNQNSATKQSGICDDWGNPPGNRSDSSTAQHSLLRREINRYQSVDEVGQKPLEMIDDSICLWNQNINQASEVRYFNSVAGETNSPESWLKLLSRSNNIEDKQGKIAERKSNNSDSFDLSVLPRYDCLPQESANKDAKVGPLMNWSPCSLTANNASKKAKNTYLVKGGRATKRRNEKFDKRDNFLTSQQRKKQRKYPSDKANGTRVGKINFLNDFFNWPNKGPLF